jgi:hypothetical protein
MVRLISNLDNIRERTYAKIRTIIEPEFDLDGVHLVYHDASLNKDKDKDCEENNQCAWFEFAESIGNVSVYYAENVHDYDFSGENTPLIYEYVLMNIDLIPENLFEKVMQMAKKLEDYGFKVTISH